MRVSPRVQIFYPLLFHNLQLINKSKSNTKKGKYKQNVIQIFSLIIHSPEFLLGQAEFMQN